MITIGLVGLVLCIILACIYLCVHTVSKNATILALVIFCFLSGKGDWQRCQSWRCQQWRCWCDITIDSTWKYACITSYNFLILWSPPSLKSICCLFATRVAAFTGDNIVNRFWIDINGLFMDWFILYIHIYFQHIWNFRCEVTEFFLNKDDTGFETEPQRTLVMANMIFHAME